MDTILSVFDACVKNFDSLKNKPRRLKIETINRCNAECVFCAYPLMKREKGVMSMEIFTKTIKYYLDMGGGDLALSPVVGDCLLDNYFVDRLAYLRKFNEINEIFIHTNLIGLSRWSDYEIKMMLRCLDYISCSIGPNRDIYKLLFQVDQFESVLKNLLRLLNLRADVDPKPMIYIAGRSSKRHCDVDHRLEIIQNTFHGKNIKWLTQYKDWGGIIKDLPHQTPVKKDIKSQGKSYLPCIIPIYSAIVYRNGQVGVCSAADYEAQMIIGDINYETLQEIWSGKKREKFIHSFSDGKISPYCAKCTFYNELTPERVLRWHMREINEKTNNRKI